MEDLRGLWRLNPLVLSPPSRIDNAEKNQRLSANIADELSGLRRDINRIACLDYLHSLINMHFSLATQNVIDLRSLEGMGQRDLANWQLGMGQTVAQGERLLVGVQQLAQLCLVTCGEFWAVGELLDQHRTAGGDDSIFNRSVARSLIVRTVDRLQRQGVAGMNWTF